MKAMLFSIWLLAISISAPAAEPEGTSVFWYQIFVAEGNHVSSFTGSAEEGWPQIQQMLARGDPIILENLREMANGVWRASEVEIEIINGKFVTHISKLQHDPLKPSDQKAPPVPASPPGPK